MPVHNTEMNDYLQSWLPIEENGRVYQGCSAALYTIMVFQAQCGIFVILRIEKKNVDLCRNRLFLQFITTSLVYIKLILNDK